MNVKTSTSRQRLYRATWQDRFWWYVNKTDTCWLWLGSKVDGYGHLGVPDVDGKWRTRKAHQLSIEIHHGPIPKGLYVLHKCHVRHCVNPNHLYIGTQKENVRDSMNIGTHRHNLPWLP